MTGTDGLALLIFGTFLFSSSPRGIAQTATCTNPVECRDMAAADAEHAFRESAPEMRVMAIGAQKDEIVFSHPDLFDIGEMRGSFRTMVRNQGLEKGLCQVGFIKMALRSSITSVGDTYVLNCSAALLNPGAETPATKPTAPAADLDVRYDKFKDMTFIATKDLKILGLDTVSPKRRNQLTLNVSYSCRGNTQNCYPQAMEVLFSAKTSFWQYMNTHGLIFIIDGKRMAVPKATWDGKVMAADDLREFVDCQMSAESILRMAAAREVEGQLGFTNFTVSQENLAALRLLVKGIRKPRIATR